MKNFSIISMFFLFAACSTTFNPHSQGREDYLETIESKSAGDKQFSGVYEQFEFKATLLNREISMAIHDRLKLYYDWGPEENERKKQERLQELENKTIIWLSFFTTDRKDDNLANANSIWKIYLVSDGKRYEGKAVKANLNFSEAQALFPYHSRWTTPYYLEFPVPTSEVENTRLQLIITGPLGRREVTF